MEAIKKNVMLIDDNLITLSSMQKALELNGIKTCVFTNPLDALVSFDEHKTMLIISDYKMPLMNGVEFMKTLRSLNCKTKAIVYTGFPDEYLIKKLGELKVILLHKPLNIAELINYIKETQNKEEEHE